MALNVPIIAPIKHKKFSILNETAPDTTYQKEYLLELLQFPEFIRNVALVGNLHHGKTTFLDTLIEQTHPTLVDYSRDESMKFTDTRNDERERLISIKCAPVSLVLPNGQSKSHLFHLLDTPGHTNFSDEVTASLRVADGACVLVDAVEGVLYHTERIIRHAVSEKLPIVVVINKMDRLILELQIPPQDAYFKIKHILHQVNEILSKVNAKDQNGSPLVVSPDRGNVCFASGEHGWSFTVQSFSKLYFDAYGRSIDFLFIYLFSFQNLNQIRF